MWRLNLVCTIRLYASERYVNRTFMFKIFKSKNCRPTCMSASCLSTYGVYRITSSRTFMSDTLIELLKQD